MRFAEDIHGALRVGLVSVRANLVPMVVLWAMAAALVLGYYQVTGFVNAYFCLVLLWIGRGNR